MLKRVRSVRQRSREPVRSPDPPPREVSSSGKFTGHAARVDPRGRVPDPGHREAGLRGSRLHRQADPGASEKQPQIAITSPDSFDVFGGYNYQSLLVWPSGAFSRSTRQDHDLELLLQALHPRQAQPASKAAPSATATRRSGRRYVDPNGSTGLPRYSGGPGNNKQIVRWIGENGKPIGGKPQPR